MENTEPESASFLDAEPHTVTLTLTLERDTVEWAEAEPGGVSAVVRGLLREARDAALAQALLLPDADAFKRHTLTDSKEIRRVLNEVKKIVKEYAAPPPAPRAPVEEAPPPYVDPLDAYADVADEDLPLGMRRLRNHLRMAKEQEERDRIEREKWAEISSRPTPTLPVRRIPGYNYFPDDEAGEPPQPDAN